MKTFVATLGKYEGMVLGFTSSLGSISFKVVPVESVIEALVITSLCTIAGHFIRKALNWVDKKWDAMFKKPVK